MRIRPSKALHWSTVLLAALPLSLALFALLLQARLRCSQCSQHNFHTRAWQLRSGALQLADLQLERGVDDLRVHSHVSVQSRLRASRCVAPLPACHAGAHNRASAGCRRTRVSSRQAWALWEAGKGQRRRCRLRRMRPSARACRPCLPAEKPCRRRAMHRRRGVCALHPTQRARLTCRLRALATRVCRSSSPPPRATRCAASSSGTGTTELSACRCASAVGAAHSAC